MPVKTICNPDVVTISKGETVQQAAELMRNCHVGDVVVVEQTGPVRIPIGIVTDRDIVIEVIARGAPTDLKVENITTGIVTARENDNEYDAAQRMHRAGIRRIPVVNEKGDLVGIFAMDDLLKYFSGELNELAAISDTQEWRICSAHAKAICDGDRARISIAGFGMRDVNEVAR